VLREVLGTHVTQKGSQVRCDRFRFDFNHPSALNREELQQIEQRVNAYIRTNSAVNTALKSPEEAMAQGALALFGEKYGKEVRVVSMGPEEKWVSVELCGGTHVDRTGDIGLFKIVQEAGVAAGIRRIEAMTGKYAEEYVQERLEILTKTSELLKTTTAELPEKIQTLLATLKNTEKKLRDTHATQAQKEQEYDYPNFKVVIQRFEGLAIQDLKKQVDQLKKKVPSGIFFVSTEDKEKISIVIGVTPNLLDSFNAHTLIQEMAVLIDGKGGGRPDLAQAGGSNPANYDKMIEHLLKHFS
jgi:alanyl-tRNA synthetase